jgi:hypothetical protein
MFKKTFTLMRYWLYYRNGEYYILASKPFGIISQAIAAGASPVSSVYCKSPGLAIKVLFAAALSHYFKSKSLPGSVA